MNRDHLSKHNEKLLHKNQILKAGDIVLKQITNLKIEPNENSSSINQRTFTVCPIYAGKFFRF